MNDKEKVYVHWDAFRFLEEKHLEENGCIVLADTIHGEYYDLMVYLFKENEKYIVRVYKSDEEDDFDKFDFDNFYDAKDFVDNLAYEHPEYKERPYKAIES